ncbi:MAG: hypothetical protein H6Q19_1303 [Bacteroidetes bacterium]|nr:hypothetical protein [Bacteroidota bacterium]
MNITEEKAIQSFRSGLNCAQSVVTAYQIWLQDYPADLEAVWDAYSKSVVP